MATIPVGSIVVGGNDSTPGFRYLSDDGVTSYAAPASDPQPGSGFTTFCRTSDGHIGVVGGGSPQFPSTGAGLYSATDLTVLNEATSSRVGGVCIAADANGYWYTLKTVFSGVFTLRFTQFDATPTTAGVVATWDIAAPAGYDDSASQYAMAVSEDGLTAYCWLPAVSPNGTKKYVHQFDLNGAGSYVGLLNSDYSSSPGVGSLVVVPGSTDLIVAYRELNGGTQGYVRRVSSAGSVIWTAGTPSGATAAHLKYFGIAIGAPGDTYFLAWSSDGDAVTTSAARYTWFDYATGTPDNTRNFLPDDGAFRFDSQFVILAQSIGGPVAPTVPPVEFVNSTPCCGDTVTPGSGSAPGPVLKGTGWTPQCTGGGTVESAADLTDSQDWDTLTERQADVWFELRLAKYPATEGTTVYRWSKRPLADTGSFKEGRLISIGRVSRRASDIDGNYQVGGWSVVVDDADQMLRTLLEQDTTTEYFLNREAGLYLLSPAGRAAALAPRTLGRGWISDVQTLKGHQVRIDVSDVVGSQMSGFNLDKTFPSVLLDDIAVEGQLVDALKGKILPVYAGELSDFGAVDINGNPAARGLVPVFDIGAIDITDPDNTDAPVSTAPTPPVITANSVVGTTGQETRYYGATLITPYGESLMSNIVSCNGASVRNLSNYNEISGTFDGGVGDINKVRIWYGPTADHMTGWLDEADYNGSGIFGYDDGAAHFPSPSRDEIDTLKGMDAPATPPDNNFHIMAVCLGYNYEILNYYVSNLADGVGPSRVEADAGIHGSEIIGPDDPEWPWSDPWIERNGIRFTGFLATGNRLKQHQDGVVTMAVNLCGPHDDDDLLINGAFRQLLWLLNEHVLKNGGTGYKTGDYWPLEEYANGDAILKTSAFEAAQTQTMDWLGDAIGYIGQIAILEPITLREFLRQFSLSFGCRLAHNHHGQVFPFFVDAPVDPTAGRALREHIEIVDIGEPTLAHDEILNRVGYSYHFDPDANEYRNPGLTSEDLVSIAAHTPGGVSGGADRRGVKQGDDRELLTNDTDTAEDVISRDLVRRAKRPRYLPYVVDLMGLEQEISDQVRGTHREGLGPGGDVLMPAMVLEHEVDVDAIEAGDPVTLLVQDLRTMPSVEDFVLASGSGDYVVASGTGDPIIAS